jgi:NADPH-dependent curcumin reductase CurA
MRRALVQGFICLDHAEDELGEAQSELLKLKKEGKLQFREDIREGIENYVDTVNLLFSGGNNGKLLLKLGEE